MCSCRLFITLEEIEILNPIAAASSVDPYRILVKSITIGVPAVLHYVSQRLLLNNIVCVIIPSSCFYRVTYSTVLQVVGFLKGV